MRRYTKQCEGIRSNAKVYEAMRSYNSSVQTIESFWKRTLKKRNITIKIWNRTLNKRNFDRMLSVGNSKFQKLKIYIISYVSEFYE